MECLRSWLGGYVAIGPVAGKSAQISMPTAAVHH